MSRSFTNYLLFENIFDNLPVTNRRLYNFAQKVLHPRVRITSDDCQTKLGNIITLDKTAVDKVSLFTYGTFIYNSGANDITETIQAEDVLTDSKVIALLTQYTQVATRDLASCTAEKGICRKCIRGSYLNDYLSVSDVPPVDSTFRITGNPTRPFLTHLTNTYSGSLLGFKSFISDRLPLREELIRSIVSEAELAQMYRELSKLPSVDENLLEYCGNISDKLEKTLMIIMLYGFFTYV